MYGEWQTGSNSLWPSAGRPASSDAAIRVGLAHRPEKLFTTQYVAGALLDVLEGLELDDSGGFYAYDGSRIEF